MLCTSSHSQIRPSPYAEIPEMGAKQNRTSRELPQAATAKLKSKLIQQFDIQTGHYLDCHGDAWRTSAAIRHQS